MSKRPICYLDLGGVVFYAPTMARYQSRPRLDLRPHTVALLKTIHDAGYELRFLSGDAEAARAFGLLLAEVFAADFPEWELQGGKVPNVFRDPAHDNFTGLEKARYIELERPFIWIEDTILSEDEQFLDSRGWADRLFRVHPFRPDELLRVKEWVRSHDFSKKPD